MDEAIRVIPETGTQITITTSGRRTGRPSRKEVRLYNLNGRFYITGSPGRRDWYANLLANPQLTVHLRRRVQADLPARATPIRDLSRRGEVVFLIHQRRGGTLGQLEVMLEHIPLVEVHLTDSSFQNRP